MRASVSFWRQRAILTVRYFFRLPVDEVREEQLKAALEYQRQLAETMSRQNELVHSLAKRLNWYETHVPLIKKEYRAFCAKQKQLAQAERRAKFKQLVEAGLPEDEARAAVWPAQQASEVRSG